MRLNPCRGKICDLVDFDGRGIDREMEYLAGYRRREMKLVSQSFVHVPQGVHWEGSPIPLVST